MCLCHEKAALRAAQKQRLRALDAAAHRAQSDALCRVILQSDAYRVAPAVAAYMPLPGEADLRPLLGDILAHKRLYLPRVMGTEMVFCAIDDLSRLQQGAFGIWEPAPACPAACLPAACLVLVPGLAFDTARRRLGRGGGYYDRYFALHRRLRMGIALCAHLCPAPLPCEPTDLAVDLLATPDGML